VTVVQGGCEVSSMMVVQWWGWGGVSRVMMVQGWGGELGEQHGSGVSSVVVW
jgi:hypothetical protein